MNLIQIAERILGLTGFGGYPVIVEIRLHNGETKRGVTQAMMPIGRQVVIVAEERAGANGERVYIAHL
jgi:hypothetical protein